MAVEKKEVESELVAALSQALVALGRAGHAEPALRIAGKTFAAVRHEAPAAAQQLNNVMHGLAKMPGPPVPSNHNNQ